MKLSIPPPSKPATPASVSTTSPSTEKCSSINRTSASKVGITENSKSSQITIDLTEGDKLQQSPPVTQKLLSKADQILAKCRQGLDSLSKPIKISDDESLFGDDDDDLLEDELMKIDESSVIVTPKKNNFLDNICPDLLKCSKNASSKFGQQKRNLFSNRNNNNNNNNNYAATAPRSGKRRLETPGSVTPKDKRLNMTTGRTESEVKRTLSKEQEAKMEENRRKALARRYQSLQRNSSC